MKYCIRCGTQCVDEAVQCPNCYTPFQMQYQPNAQYPPPNYSYPPPNYQTPPIYVNNTVYAFNGISIKGRWIAFILCLFLGLLGVHRFYVGKVGTGLLWLFTGGLFGIGWLVDLILIACGSFTDYSGCFLKN